VRVPSNRDSTYAYDGTTPTATSSPQHIAVTGSRGNVTTINKYKGLSTFLSTTLTYYDTGEVSTSTEPNGNRTTYSYAGSSCGNTFPTSVTVASLVSSYSWDCNGGVMLSSTDVNQKQTTFAHSDPFWRVTSVTSPYQNGTFTTSTTNYINPNKVETVLNVTSGNAVMDTTTFLDGLGRLLRTQDEDGTNYNTVSYKYDTNGRLSQSTLPCSVISLGADCTFSPSTTTTYNYDALNRPLLITDSAGGYVSHQYTNNDVLQKIGPQTTIPATEPFKQKQFEYDGAGRLTSVCEITSSLPGGGTCTQKFSQPGYWTKYTYDGADRLRSVSQNAQGTSQPRSYAYDLLGRMTSETNPETGTTNYYYDSYFPAGSCWGSGTSNGNLMSIVDGAGNTTCFLRDEQAFQDRVMVIAPHIESGGGIYETLRELQQVRMAAMRHSVLCALSFNKPETRERIQALLSQPDYKREKPLSLIQSSDAHGSRGTVGQPRAEVKVLNGRPTYTSIKEAFSAGRVKCSIDFVDEEYRSLIEGEPLAKFVASPEVPGFREQDFEELSRFVCAALNSSSGVVQLDINIKPEQQLGSFYPEKGRKTMESILENRLDPSNPVLLTRALLLSNSRVRILVKPVSRRRLYTQSGIVYVLEASTPRPARAVEIETRVAEIIDARFGGRFRRTLERSAEDSKLLSKMPRSISLLLRSSERLSMVRVKQLGIVKIDSVSVKGREAAEEAMQLYHHNSKAEPFGLSRGNTLIILPHLEEVRDEEHYIRFQCLTTDLKDDQAQKLSTARLDGQSILVATGGAAHLGAIGYFIANSPAVRIQMPNGWKDHLLACLGWLKSSFFIWYCAVHLSDKDLYQQLQKPDVSLPFPLPSRPELLDRLDVLVNNIILEEQKVLAEIQKETKRGLDVTYREKLRKRHNTSVNALCMAIDDAIAEGLSLNESEVTFIARTLRDLDMTDFGVLAKVEAERTERQAKEDDQ
jgi:YD repeat-containing protein